MLSLLLLAALLNIWTNLFMVQVSCFSYLSSAIFVDLSCPFPNSFFNAANSSLANKNSKFFDSKSARIFSFHTSAVSPYTYVEIQCTCSSTNSSLIFILIYSLHAVTKPAIFPEFPSNNGSLATSGWNLYLGLGATSSSPLYISPKLAANCACRAASCFACCLIRSCNYFTVLY